MGQFFVFWNFGKDNWENECTRFQNSPIPNFKIVYAEVAQLVEQLICNQQVAGSSPIFGSQEFGV